MEYLTRHFPKLRVLVLTMISNPLILTRLRELGVLAVIQKNQLHDEIETALKAIAKGSPVRCKHPRRHP
jgi:two-component system capsular synthesis response regulator RcsB